MSKKKPRRLWLNIQANFRGRKPSYKRFIQTLINSIDNTTYELPQGWDVTLLWRNKEDAPMKSGSWGEEMSASAESSEGFDMAVRAFLERKLYARS